MAWSVESLPSNPTARVRFPAGSVVVVVVEDWGFTTLLTSLVISVAFYIEREKSDKFCSEALISAWSSFHRQWHDSPLCTLAFLRSSRHSWMFSATHLQFLIPNVLMSYRTQSSHLILGLPTFLVPSRKVLITLFVVLWSLVRSTCPAHSSLLILINLTIYGPLNRL